MQGKVVVNHFYCLQVNLPDRLGGIRATLCEIDQPVHLLREDIVTFGPEVAGKLFPVSYTGIGLNNHVKDPELSKLVKKFMRLAIAEELEHGQVIDSEV